MIYVGQSMSYEPSAELLCKLLRTPINDTQVFRQVTEMGAHASELMEQVPEPAPVGDEQRVYVQVDGSMLLTREEKWKETKLGRLFYETDVYEESHKRGWIKKSQYLAHLGGHEVFEEKMGRLVDAHAHLGERLVFVTDGAKWISDWVSAEYPKATQILDFYHAMEHLGDFAKVHFEDKLKRDYWLEENRVRLQEKGIQEVIRQIGRLKPKSKEGKEEKADLLSYYRKNAYRMDYPKYLEKGLMIGSGAVEAAHRTLIQSRMRLSGQRWSKGGAQKMLDLRALKMSNRWDEIVNVLRKAA